MKCVLRDVGLVRGIENLEKSKVRDIGCKFVKFFREKNGSQFFFDDRELQEIGVQSIESHLYLSTSIPHNQITNLTLKFWFCYQQYMFTIIEILVFSSPLIILSVNLSSAHFHLQKHKVIFNLGKRQN